MSVEHTILSVPEERAGGRAVISTEGVPRVRITMTEPEEGIRDYSVRGFVPLERAAVTSLLQLPINDEVYTWQETRDGLRNFAYPSRRVAALGRSALHVRQLGEVKGATRELANILTNNQDYWIKSANIPVFNYAEAQQYAADILYTKTSERKLLLMLKSVGLDHSFASHLYSVINSAIQTPEGINQLELIKGMDLASRTSAQVEAMLSEVDGRFVTEIIHRLQYKLFVGFPEQAHLEEGILVGGSNDLTVLLRESDIPVALPLDFTNVSVDAPRVGVSMSEELRDKDRKTGRSRRQVIFYTEMERQMAVPLLAWRTQDDTRKFLFPVSSFERQRRGIARPSSLLGVALAAGALGSESGVDYAKAMHKRLKRAPASLGRAGLFPLIATHQERDILHHPYFEHIEDQL